MQDLIKLDFKNMVILNGSDAVTTSFKVAEFFNKQHKDVLKAIRNLECSQDFTKLNFALCFKNNDLQNGKPQPYYLITKDGFMFLAMGFRGKKAAQIKEAYINAFNWLANELQNNQSNYEQYLRLLNKFNDGKNKASFFGRGLANWRKSKKYLNNKLDTLQTKIQPCLPIFKESLNAY